MATQICERCGQRPAVATVRRTGPTGEVQEQRLCEVCLAELGLTTGNRFGRSGGSGLMGGSLFDEFFSDFFDRGRTGVGAGAGAGGEGAGAGAGGQAAGGGGAPMGRTGQGRRRVEQVDVTEFFSDATRELLQRAARAAVEWGSLDLDTEHLLYAAMQDDLVSQVVRHAEGDPQAIAAQIEDEVEKAKSTEVSPSLSPEAKAALLAAYEEMQELGASYLGPEHVLLALARDPGSEAGRLLNRFGLTHTKLRSAVIRGVTQGAEGGTATSQTKTVDEYSRDLTQAARDGRLDPVIGRADEIEETIEILSRRTKNNPVLIGEPGVGKTAIAEGIAQRIVNDEVPETLAGKRVLQLDLAGMVAGTKYRGEFEERMKGVIDEVTEHGEDLILFIDEIHTVVGAGAAEGSMDASNMLKPALARGDMHIIGSTTLDEYRKNIEKDAALERRFQPVLVDEPTVDETIEILNGLKDRYEAYHKVRITGEAVVAAAELSDRYISDRFLPDKAIDLIDQAAARVRLRSKMKPDDRRALEDELRGLERDKDQAVAAQQYERANDLKAQVDELRTRMDDESGTHRHQRAAEVTAEDIAEVISRRTGIPIAQLTQEERERLMNLEQELHERVVGQEEAVSAVARAVRRARAGLGDPNRPEGSFLFLGPTGVGKTELARALAVTLFGDESAMVRFDMSEFQERHTVSRLVGSPPGYVGYEEAGQLTERVRRHPYSVLLLDEIEKAHPDIFNILLQVLDDGRLTDAQGRTVSFKNTIVIMTSNIGADRIQEYASTGGDFDQLKEELNGILRGQFRPELLNRIDEIIVFRALEKGQLRDITRLLLEKVARRMHAQNVEVEITDAAVDYLAEEGYDPQFGARPLRRAIQRLLEDELSDRLLSGDFNPGDRVRIDAREGRIAVESLGPREDTSERALEPEHAHVGGTGGTAADGDGDTGA